jgi:hypothetical protein
VPRAENIATFICRLSKNCASLNLLETSGLVQACTGIALPLYIAQRGFFTPFISQIMRLGSCEGNVLLFIP